MRAFHRPVRNKLRHAHSRVYLAVAVVLGGLSTGSLAQPATEGGPIDSGSPTVAQEQIAALPADQLILARVEAAGRVAVTPRVTGHIQDILFTEGQEVEQGQPMFRIDPRPFEIAVEHARAELTLAKVREQLAYGEAVRARELAQAAAIALDVLDQREADLAIASAQTLQASTRLKAAELDLEFTLVTAPISGRVGRALITRGNYVSGSGESALATIVTADDLDVHFDIADRALIASDTESLRQQFKVRVFDGDTERELARVPVDFVNNEVDAKTGTLRMRARISGQQTGLLPGQYVLVSLQAQTAVAAAEPAAADPVSNAI